MSETHGPQNTANSRVVQINAVRAVVAALLLATVFAVLFFVLLPRSGGAGSVPPARMLDTPPGPDDASPGVHAGYLARDFVATDLDEVEVSLGSLRGRPVVINFWATWCTSCLVEMPVLEQQRVAHAEDNLVIVAINVGESTGKASGFIDSLELFDFVIAMDPDLTISDSYNVRGLPHSVFIDRDGIIQAEYRGQLDEETMNGYVQAAIDAVPGRDGPNTPRFVSTIPREHVLEAVADQVDASLVVFVSRRFRCDDDYCAEPLALAIRGIDGVTSAELRSEDSEPSLLLRYDSGSFEDIVAAVAEVVGAFEDPLYTRELEVRITD